MPNKKIKKEQLGSIQSDFITLTSHQLRTPLSGMRWLLELLMQPKTGPLNKKQKDYLAKIYSSNERMIALVNDLLEVSRLDQGDTNIYLQPTDIVQIIRGLIKEKESSVKAKHLKIVFTTEHEPFPMVKTDTNRIKQALGNILSNAISYTPDGGSITIDLKILDGHIQGMIKDTGVGIPKDQMKNVFTKFFRAPNVLQFETVGTGLGLYITKEFIERSGGKIWIESEENKGTTIYFKLPRIE
ncbi:MAG TPA: HAMP domain-containing sensor histidine kinase [Candidatus Binatia bacterium]|nr:HAMP domain-containing sensor histidine kinase [Candidatus Binatia bacterium]